MRSGSLNRPTRRVPKLATITALAGVNGSGKSSVQGRMKRAEGVDYYNPDEEAQRLRARFPGMSDGELNGYVWQAGLKRLRCCIDAGDDFVFETTLGGNTICNELIRAAILGHQVVVWYVGLATVQDNIRRVRERHARGGHDIPTEKIEERFESSPRNLIRLLPYLDSLAVFDNTAELSKTGRPNPIEILRITNRRISFTVAVRDCPAWAHAIIEAAHETLPGQT